MNSPTVQANVQNGLPVVRFNGTNQYINFGNVLNLGTNGLTVFMVSKFSTNAGQVGMVGKASYRGNFGRWAMVYDTVAGGPTGIGVDFFMEDTNQVLAGMAFNPSTQFNIFTGVNNRTSLNQIYANGTLGNQQTFTATANNMSNTDPLYVAAYPDGFGSGPQPGLFMNGDIAEVLVYFSTFTTTQRQQVEGYLAWKWGLTANLPTGHPYKTPPLAPFPYASRLLRTRSWLPTQISGCQLWLDAADRSSITTSGTVVTQWTDKSGTSRTTTFAGASNTYSSALQAVSTDNATTSYFFANVNLKKSVIPTATVFLVHTWTGSSLSSTNQALWGQDIGGGWNRFQLLGFTATPAFAFGLSYTPNSPNVTTVSALNTSSRTLYSATYAYQVANGTSAFVNGSLASSTVTEAVSPSETTTTNTYFGTIDTGYAGSVAFHEILIYTSAISTNQRQQVEGYLAWKWGLAGNLPNNHPFKLFPPPPI